MRKPPTSTDLELRQRGARYAEWLCWTLAALLIMPQAASMAARAALAGAEPGDDWSSSRRTAYLQLIGGAVPSPQGLLKLPAQREGIPVFQGAEEPQLTLGAGHLPETSPLGGPGNTVLAGHRDGFFRRLRDVAVGDLLEVQSAGVSRRYRVTDLWVVAPRDVWVLEETPRPSLTLITCHPFYYVGHAPNRFVVRAVAVGEVAASATKMTRMPGGKS